jgi:predicted NBD/HSP70 family sugar kinase
MPRPTQAGPLKAAASGVTKAGHHWQPAPDRGISSPRTMRQTSPYDGPASDHILSLIRAGSATTRMELMEATGLSRSTVAERLKELLDTGLIIGAGQSVSTGGRRPSVFKFNGSAGIVISASIDWTTIQVAILDLAGNILAGKDIEHDISKGPTATLETLVEHVTEMHRDIGQQHRIWGVGIGLTGPVDFAAGRALSAMGPTGWDGFPVSDWLIEKYRCPVLVDTDTNLMVMGQRVLSGKPCNDMVFVKAGANIGASFIFDGHLFRGAFGSAGNIGHTYLPGHEDTICACGRTGCLEAVASGRAIAARLTGNGMTTASTTDVVLHVQQGHEAATAVVRQAGIDVGLVLANIVNAFNPSMIVVGGELSAAGDPFLAGIREAVYGHCPAHATRNLHINISSNWRKAAILGAAGMVVSKALEIRAAGEHASYADL